MRLDGDAALLLQVHRIEQLVLHLARRDGARPVQQPVRKRRLPMIDMGDDAEISYMRCVHLPKAALQTNSDRFLPGRRNCTFRGQMPIAARRNGEH